MKFLAPILILALFCATHTKATTEFATTNSTVATTVLVSLGNTSTIVDGKAVDVPVLSLRMAPPKLDKHPEVSFTFKVLSWVKPSITYTYIPGAAKTLSGCLAAGGSAMLPVAQLTIVRTIVELGPQYTTAVVGGRTEYIGGLGATMGLLQQPANKMSGFFVFVGAGWDINRSEMVYTTGFGHALP